MKTRIDRYITSDGKIIEVTFCDDPFFFVAVDITRKNGETYTSLGKRKVHFTHGQAKELQLGPPPDGGMQKSLTLHRDSNGSTFVIARGKKVSVGRLPMSNHYHAEG